MNYGLLRNQGSLKGLADDPAFNPNTDPEDYTNPNSPLYVPPTNNPPPPKPKVTFCDTVAGWFTGASGADAAGLASDSTQYIVLGVLGVGVALAALAMRKK